MGWFSKAFSKIGKSAAGLIGDTVSKGLDTVTGLAGNVLNKAPQLAGPLATALTGVPLGDLGGLSGLLGGAPQQVGTPPFVPTQYQSFPSDGSPFPRFPAQGGMSDTTKTLLIAGGAAVVVGAFVFVATRKK